MATEHYDTLSIGSGQGGNFVCWTRASAGKKTAVIERKWLGGSCPNVACLPTKNVLYSAEVLHLSQKYAATGLLKTAGTGVDMAVVRQRKREMVEGMADTDKGAFEKSGAEYVAGHGKLVGEQSIEVELDGGGKRIMTADNILICTGSTASIPNTPGIEKAKPLTHIEMLELDEVPKHLVILGGGYSGLEFAQAFRRFGSEVTVLERNKKILKREDDDVSSALVEILMEEGIQFHTSVNISNVSGISGQSVTLSGTRDGQPLEVKGSHLLVAGGRVPNTQNMGLETVGIDVAASGHVKVNEYLQTSVPGIFALGDCAGSPYFTHIGFDDYRIVSSFLDNKQPLRSTTGRQVPSTLYTSPELAHVGLSENEARRTGVECRLAKLPMAAVLRSRTMDATRGFAKALVSAENDAILGFTALGPRAGEMLPVVQLAMSAGLPYTSIAGLIVTHPTMCEGLVALFGSVAPRS
ncbi:FAD-dependent pyridine nucleotide-disulfide oxidoreductase [Lophiostoma macrostomum CBS 122681]|uniref:FAD-dependent pyridine nucleotide-disulfide oxidoreductase n=1 Tax=Lophiostoma macrostomum CBS 122681 TaxID=1314788 RepID=A0A6A6TGU7_9PLEO|nr:FAD-dependent pyridine nucleotide-disulfide oxidoreductase [Lophiostoma macrostomum CBS 122681]